MWRARSRSPAEELVFVAASDKAVVLVCLGGWSVVVVCSGGIFVVLHPSLRRRPWAPYNLQDMTRCLLCGFDSKDKTGHGQVSCDLRHLPCRRTLPAGNPFKRYATSCSDLACVCKKTCPTCDITGHDNRTLAVNSVHFRSGAGGSILRKEGAPPLCGADFVCHEIKDLQASGFVKAVLTNYQKKLDDSTRLAGATKELVGNTSRSGLNPSAILARMGEMGMKAATLDPSNRAHFEESSRLLQKPDVSAVDAALGACGVLVGRPARLAPKKLVHVQTRLWSEKK